VSNILVLKDPENTDNEGKVFLFRYGQKIYDKIKAQLRPKDEEDEKVNVFDFWSGADFRLEIKNVAGYRNYDDSNFKRSSALFKGDDAKLEEIFNKLQPLLPFKSDDKYKEFDVLEKKFEEIVSGVAAKVQKKADEVFGDDPKPSAEAAKPKRTRKPAGEDESTAPWEDAVKKPQPAKKPVAAESTEEEMETASEDDLSYYETLAND
jgi:hypothetical protein